MFYCYEQQKYKNFLYCFITLIIIIIEYIIYLNYIKINNIKVCLCTVGKLENNYIKEFIMHYRKYGVDKIFSL